MKRIFKIFLKIMFTVLAIVLVFVIGIAIFIKTSPQFGAKIEGDQLEEIKQSPNFKDGEFINLTPTILNNIKPKDMVSMMYNLIFNPSQGTPKSPLPVNFGEGEMKEVDSIAYVTWYGHSAILLEMEGKSILIDPMLGPASAPVSFATKRFTYENAIEIENLKNIDAVILSHDHYDHLDYPTIIKIKDEVKHFYTALGVGEHLASWGVPREKITQLDWWESSFLENIELIATPARHFSGRGVSDRNKTQWASWVIKGQKSNIYFSGDGGYANHFQEIGNRYGPFDFAMVECGQYNELWAQIHMTPEETVQASIDVQAKVMMPIHWGAFKLAPHDWKDPIERVIAESNLKNVEVSTPAIGERFSIGNASKTNWWENVE
ncbi:MAG: MBL fold metallo-hydrolase [Cyclobacteriaceae bacterium]